MEYTQLGRTGLRVSRLGFGGAALALKNYLGAYDPAATAVQDAAVAAIHRAIALGVNYIDTAPAYCDGLSERLIGQALRELPEQQQPIVATKFSVWDAGSVRASVEASLERLGRESLDLLQLHGLSISEEQADAVLQPGGRLEQMERLRDEGLVRHLGFTSEDHNPPVHRFIRSGRFDVMQIGYNLLYQHAYNPSPGRQSGAIFEADRAGLGVVAMRTPTSGLFQKWMRLVRPTDDFDYTPALIQFVLSNPLVDVALVGMRSVTEVEANVRTAENMAGRIDLDALFTYYV
jgi:aryl-alcohol dehydrogenase-like predicted oxidoreductase